MPAGPLSGGRPRPCTMWLHTYQVAGWRTVTQEVTDEPTNVHTHTRGERDTVRLKSKARLQETYSCTTSRAKAARASAMHSCALSAAATAPEVTRYTQYSERATMQGALRGARCCCPQFMAGAPAAYDAYPVPLPLPHMMHGRSACTPCTTHLLQTVTRGPARLESAHSPATHARGCGHTTRRALLGN